MQYYVENAKNKHQVILDKNNNNDYNVLVMGSYMDSTGIKEI